MIIIKHAIKAHKNLKRQLRFSDGGWTNESFLFYLLMSLFWDAHGSESGFGFASHKPNALLNLKTSPLTKEKHVQPICKDLFKMGNEAVTAIKAKSCSVHYWVRRTTSKAEILPSKKGCQLTGKWIMRIYLILKTGREFNSKLQT